MSNFCRIFKNGVHIQDDTKNDKKSGFSLFLLILYIVYALSTKILNEQPTIKTPKTSSPLSTAVLTLTLSFYLFNGTLLSSA